MTKPQTDVASLELSRELYELSGWEDTYFVSIIPNDGVKRYKRTVLSREEACTAEHCNHKPVPAYTLGYLLRKLPPRIEPGKDPGCLSVHSLAGGSWIAQYDKQLDMPQFSEGGVTPENAACKLAIELIKQKVIKP